MTVSPVIQCTNVGVHYDQRTALRNATISLYPGETLSLLGPNGAGKSTLLKLIAGMIPPSHGEVTLHGAPLKGPSRAITYVPQRSDADWDFPISVLDAVLLALSKSTSRFRGFGSNERTRAHDALKSVGMDHLAQSQIGALSGGQQQRVFLARALMSRGDVLLLDEPFTGVDVPTQEMLVDIFDELRASGTSVVYATHDLAQAARTSDRVVLLNRDLIAVGPPADTLTEPLLRETFGGQVLVLSPTQATVAGGAA